MGDKEHHLYRFLKGRRSGKHAQQIVLTAALVLDRMTRALQPSSPETEQDEFARQRR
jgi:hypothetical protein